MAEIYGHRWTSAYGDDSGPDGAAGTWAKGLAGVTMKQVADGLKACVVSSDPWPPTLPEFRAMCLGVPSFPSVRVDSEKASPFTQLVWQNLDGYLYRQASSERADKMLRDAYELAREHVMNGGELPSQSAGQIQQEEKPKWTAPAEAEREHILAQARQDAGL